MDKQTFEIEAMTKLAMINNQQLLSRGSLTIRYKWLKLLEQTAEKFKMLQVLRYTRIKKKNLEIFCRDRCITL